MVFIIISVCVGIDVDTLLKVTNGLTASPKSHSQVKIVCQNVPKYILWIKKGFTRRRGGENLNFDRIYRMNRIRRKKTGSWAVSRSEGNTELSMNPEKWLNARPHVGADSLAPACSALPGLRLRRIPIVAFPSNNSLLQERVACHLLPGGEGQDEGEQLLPPAALNFSSTGAPARFLFS
jgi:hypothetical protein